MVQLKSLQTLAKYTLYSVTGGIVMDMHIEPRKNERDSPIDNEMFVLLHSSGLDCVRFRATAGPNECDRAAVIPIRYSWPFMVFYKVSIRINQSYQFICYKSNQFLYGGLSPSEFIQTSIII